MNELNSIQGKNPPPHPGFFGIERNPHAKPPYKAPRIPDCFLFSHLRAALP
jgi:hypothetical protein